MIRLHLTMEGDLEIDEGEALEEYGSKDPYAVAAAVTRTFNELLNNEEREAMFVRPPTALVVPR